MFSCRDIFSLRLNSLKGTGKARLQEIPVSLIPSSVTERKPREKSGRCNPWGKNASQPESSSEGQTPNRDRTPSLFIERVPPGSEMCVLNSKSIYGLFKAIFTHILQSPKCDLLEKIFC